MNQQIEQLLKTVQNRQAKISKEQSAMDEEIKQIEKIFEQENKSWKDFWKIPEKTFEDYVEEYMDWAGGKGLPRFTRGPEHWFMGDKCGLLWYIITNKSGSIKDFMNLIGFMIDYDYFQYYKGIEDYTFAREIYKLLPQEFINSFKDKK